MILAIPIIHHQVTGSATLTRSTRGTAIKYIEFFTPTEYILNHLERLVIDGHHDLLGYQDLVNLLYACNNDTVKEIKSSPEEFLRYTQVLRQLLDKRISLVNIQQISQEYINLHQDGQNVSELANLLADKIAA